MASDARGNQRAFGGAVPYGNGGTPPLHTGLSDDFSGARIHGADVSRPPLGYQAEYELPLDMFENPPRESVLMDDGAWNQIHQVQRCAYEWDRFASEVRVPTARLAQRSCRADEHTHEHHAGDTGVDRSAASSAAREIGDVSSRYWRAWDAERDRLVSAGRASATPDAAQDAFGLCVMLIDSMIASVRDIHALADDVVVNANSGASGVEVCLALRSAESRVGSIVDSIANKLQQSERSVRIAHDDRVGSMMVSQSAGTTSIARPVAVAGVGALIALLASAAKSMACATLE